MEFPPKTKNKKRKNHNYPIIQLYPTSGYTSKGNEINTPKRDLHSHVCCITIQKSQDVKINWGISIRRTDKENVAYISKYVYKIII